MIKIGFGFLLGFVLTVIVFFPNAPVGRVVTELNNPFAGNSEWFCAYMDCETMSRMLEWNDKRKPAPSVEYD